MQKALLISTTALISIAADQFTKYLANQYLIGREAISYFNDFFVLSYHINHGAFLSLGSTLPEHLRTLIFSVLVGIFLVGFTIYALRNQAFTRWHNIACGLILSGGFSNLYDRITNNGGVVDFMIMGIGNVHTGVFNVADMAIMAGTFLLIFYTAKTPEK
ncbi:MAG TPA: signal peptidase II [Cellvibrio sp.]|nr:signal peptidase II [Cellvibrio sp.]